MPMQIVSRLFKKQGATNSKNDGKCSPKLGILSEESSTLHPMSHLRRWKSAKSLSSIRRSYSMTFKKSPCEETTPPEVPPLPNTPRYTDPTRKNISNIIDVSAKNESPSLMQNPKRFLVFYRLEDGGSGLPNKTLSRRRQKQSSRTQAQPSDTLDSQMKYLNNDYSNVRPSISSDGGSDSDFDEEGVRDSFKFEKVISRFPHPPEMDGQTLHSLPSSANNHNESVDMEDFSLSSVTKTSIEVKDKDSDSNEQISSPGFVRDGGAEINVWPGSISTEPFPRDIDPETLSSTDPSDIDYLKSSEEDSTNFEVQNLHHGRMPSISKRQFWHLPFNQASEPPKITANQLEEHENTRNSPNQSSRKWDMQNRHTLMKRTKSLVYIRRPRCNSNL